MENKKIITKWWEVRRFKGIKLKEPIKVIYDKNKEGEYLFTIDDLNIFAYGKDLKEVQEEIKRDLYYVYDKLFLQKLDLAPPAEKIKENFKKYLYAPAENN